MGKSLLFYGVGGTIIGLVLQALGADFKIVLLGSLLIPPAIMLVIAIARFNRI